MKYTHGKNVCSVVDWLNDQAEYFKIIAFVHDIFRTEGVKIGSEVAVPKVSEIQFHYNPSQYIFCLDRDDHIYLNEETKGKQQAAILITALVHYYSDRCGDPDPAALRKRVLDPLIVELTLSEIAVTSTLVVGGIIIGKSILNRIF